MISALWQPTKQERGEIRWTKSTTFLPPLTVKVLCLCECVFGVAIMETPHFHLVGGGRGRPQGEWGTSLGVKFVGETSFFSSVSKFFPRDFLRILGHFLLFAHPQWRR